jgi:hypothetical protein
VNTDLTLKKQKILIKNIPNGQTAEEIYLTRKVTANNIQKQIKDTETDNKLLQAYIDSFKEL